MPEICFRERATSGHGLRISRQIWGPRVYKFAIWLPRRRPHQSHTFYSGIIPCAPPLRPNTDRAKWVQAYVAMQVPHHRVRRGYINCERLYQVDVYTAELRATGNKNVTQWRAEVSEASDKYSYQRERAENTQKATVAKPRRKSDTAGTIL